MGTPIPSGAIIDAGTSLLNSAATIFTNKSQRKYNEKMYAKQRADSLSDWTRQNEYNSPTSQMQRLREAGLNPNLVYGKGADNTAGAIHSTDAGSYKPDAPEIKFSARESLINYQNLKMMQAQTDNLKVQNTVLAQEKLLKEAQRRATLANAGLSEFNLGQKQTLSDTDIEYRKQQLRKIQADTSFTLSENERRAAMQAPNLEKAISEVFRIRAETARTEADRRRIIAARDNIISDTYLKVLDGELKEIGVQPSDPIYTRILARIISLALKEGKPVEGLQKKLMELTN